ncbi:MAG TPA: c-type cytochrome [Vicinamibacterales bacterium]|jgi:mono/diheme cytochrome c family protein
MKGRRLLTVAIVAATGAAALAQGRGVITSPRNAYPDRAAADPASVERGRALYGVNCAFCHGADTRGGDSGPSLLRSGVVLDDQHGELIGPIVQNGRTDRGMPKFQLTPGQIADVAAFIHTFKAAGYDESRQKPPTILVGDAAAGKAYFGARCASCHSPAGDLRGVATKINDERLLQQTLLMPGTGGRGAATLVAVPPTMATIRLATGETIEGRVERMDDFTIAIVTADGQHRSFRTEGADAPRVEITDPLQGHRDLLRVYSDKDIHNLTAYLWTLK